MTLRSQLFDRILAWIHGEMRDSLDQIVGLLLTGNLF
jgi:hypothetical protein